MVISPLAWLMLDPAAVLFPARVASTRNHSNQVRKHKMRTLKLLTLLTAAALTAPASASLLSDIPHPLHE